MVLAVDPDDDDYAQSTEVEQFCNTLDITYPAGVEDTATYELFRENFDGTNPFPVDVIIDKQGIIRYVSREYDPQAMTAVIQELLSE